MRKNFVAAVLMGITALAMLTACEDKKEAEKSFFDREQISSVVIEDAVKGYYEDDLEIELGSNELSVFMSLVPELELRDGQSGQLNCLGGSYNIVCRNESGDAVYTFTVDSSHNLNMDDKYLWHNEAADEFFDKLENKYGLKTSENYSRNPGEGYFSVTDRIAKIDFSEYTETNFDEGVEYTLTEKEVEELKDGVSSAAFSSEQTANKDEYLYMIWTYDKWGSLIYQIVVRSDVVEINDRAVDYDSVKDWLKKIEDVSGYVRE